MNEMNDSYLLAGAEDLSREFNDLASFYSDFYKEVYGSRPRHMMLCACDYSNEFELYAALGALRSYVSDLEKASVEVFAREELDRKKAIDDFEAYITKCLQVGATNRADAIAWICDSHDVPNENTVWGWEHLEYRLNIPYGYIAKSFNAQVAA
jgi:hypothetical protein